MPKVFVHGVPETNRIWEFLFDELRARGEEDIVALSPPGFGAPVPSEFEATRTGYLTWLVDQLEILGGNVDLVGHDWGAIHLFGVLEERPDLLRSWAADAAGVLHPDYVWHEFAQAWQTPEVGEQAIKEMFGLSEEDATQILAEISVPMEHTGTLAPYMDETMGDCVLSLYRSGAQPELSKLGQRLKTTEKRPGLVLIPLEDPFTGKLEMPETTANELGANVCHIEGVGHWWMFASASTAADALISHWRTAEAAGAD